MSYFGKCYSLPFAYISGMTFFSPPQICYCDCQYPEKQKYPGNQSQYVETAGDHGVVTSCNTNELSMSGDQLNKNDSITRPYILLLPSLEGSRSFGSEDMIYIVSNADCENQNNDDKHSIHPHRYKCTPENSTDITVNLCAVHPLYRAKLNSRCNSSNGILPSYLINVI